MSSANLMNHTAVRMSADSLDEAVNRAQDRVLVTNLVCWNIIGVERWEREKRQSVFVSLTLWGDLTKAGHTDSVRDSHHYGQISGAVTQFAERSRFKSVEALATGIAQVVVTCFGVAKVTVKVAKPTALLYAKAAGVTLTRTAHDFAPGYERFLADSTSSISDTNIKLDPTDYVPRPHPDDCVCITNLLLRCIIGVNPWERDEKQTVIINISMFIDVGSPGKQDTVAGSVNYRTVCRWVVAHVEASQYKTLEALTLSVARALVVDMAIPKVTVRIEKPCALLTADSSGVEITRAAEDFV